MREEDIARVSAIVCSCYRWMAEQAGCGLQQLDLLIHTRGTPDAIRGQLENCQFFVACVDDSPVGVVGINENQITKLYVDLRWQRRNLGTALFKVAEAKISHAGHRTLFLGASRFAVPFYQAMGMTISRRKAIPLNPMGHEIIIMEKQLLSRI